MKIILFDGTCNLCNYTVQFILRKDTKEVFTFSSLQSTFGQTFLKSRNLDAENFTSFILYEEHKAYYTQSSAALEVIRHFNFNWKILYSIGILTPKIIRDFIYSFVSQHRYQWFGKTSCEIPKPQWKGRFIE